MIGRIPKDPSELLALLEAYDQEADAVLSGSDMLAGLDLERERDARKAFKRLEGDRNALEWWAFMMKALAQDLQDRLGGGGDREVALAGLRLQAVRSMFVFKQSMEEHVWAGYEQTQLLYDVVSSAARTPAEADAIQATRALFANLTEDVLHAWVEAEVEIGPRIGVTAVDEDLLKALAKYHLSLFDRRRAEDELARQHRSRIWTNRAAAASAGAAVTAAIVGLLKAVGVL